MSGMLPAVDRASSGYQVKKAGFFIYGDVEKNGRTQRYVIAPYSEGRFDHSRRHFSLAKGSVDKDTKTHRYEDPWEAAIRETKEEAGIDIVKLVGKENLEKLRDPALAKEVKFPLLSPGIPGVLIKRVLTKPVADQVCVNRKGDTDLRTQMFAIELMPNHIIGSPIRKELKNTLDVHKHVIDHPLNEHRNGDVKEPVRQILDSDGAYPNRRDLMEWMMTGTMPEKPWNRLALEKLANGKPDAELTEADKLLPGNEDGAWFKAILKRELGYVPEEDGHPRLERNEWRELFHGLPDDEQKKIVDLTKHIRDTLKKFVPSMSDDNAIFKIDTSDIPLNVYQEGADVMLLGDYIAQSIDEAKANMEYSRTFLGRMKEGEPLTRGILQSQLGMATSIASNADFKASRRHGESVVGLLQAHRLKFAEQQEALFGEPIEPDAAKALARMKTRTLATINDESHRGVSPRKLREHAARKTTENDTAAALG